MIRQRTRSPDALVSRYSNRPFPSYQFLPGANPHPVRDPAGHSYEPKPSFRRQAPWHPQDWRALDDWLFGVDLFNAHYFWEAHEAWEGLWVAMERSSAAAVFVQGLIQISAALLKARLGALPGVQMLSRQGLEKLGQVAAESPSMMGLDLVRLIAALQAYFAPVWSGELPEVAAAPKLELDQTDISSR